MKWVYIHGLYSNAASRKYVLLKRYFPHFDWNILEWTIEDNLPNVLKQFNQEYLDQELTIVGDSAGANLAVQIKLLREQLSLNTSLILLNPLLNFTYRISDYSFPKPLIPFFKNFSIQDLNQTSFLLSLEDELIDHTWISAYPELNQFWVKDDHRLSNFKDHMLLLKEFF